MELFDRMFQQVRTRLNPDFFSPSFPFSDFHGISIQLFPQIKLYMVPGSMFGCEKPGWFRIIFAVTPERYCHLFKRAKRSKKHIWCHVKEKYLGIETCIYILYLFEGKHSTISPSRIWSSILQVTGRNGQAGKYAHVNQWQNIFLISWQYIYIPCWQARNFDFYFSTRIQKQ